MTGFTEFSENHDSNPTDGLGLPLENTIDVRDLEGVIVKLVEGSAVAQAKQTWSRFDPFEGWLFCPFLIFENGVFLSAIVKKFEFVYLVSSCAFHSPSPGSDCLGCKLAGLCILRIQQRRSARAAVVRE
jgi:hypothetical protein